MYFKSARIVLGIFFLAASFCSAQRPRNCDPGNQCKLLTSCPQMVDQIDQKSICGYAGKETKVCCPTTLTSPTTKPAQSANLLPTICGQPANPDKSLIRKIFQIEAYPWIAALGYTEPGISKTSFNCAGAIINKKYVLTAAHCLDPAGLGRKSLSVIHLGDNNLATERDCIRTRLGERCFTPHIVAGVEETVSHPLYNKRGRSSDDIALIRLNTTLNFESNSATIEPVCLPPDGFNFKDFVGNRNLVAAGWGLTEHGNNSDILLEGTVSIADDALCKEKYRESFVGNQLCIGGTGEGFSTCNGDGGIPLVISAKNGPPFVQVGIASFGAVPCGLKGFPDVYTNVADYRNWIINNMKP